LQNIDPVYFLLPIIAIAFSFGLVIYWHFKRRLTKWVLLYSLIAYAGAIALKYVVQIPTIRPFETAVGGNPFALGAYYGLQTVVFEVGGAYVVASYAARQKHLNAHDAEGYGLGLALWENGVYIGIFTLIDFISYYAILSSGSSSLSQLIYNTLSKNSPGLFYGPVQALPAIGLGILERVSSLLVHFAWGYLCILAVTFRRKIFFLLALPMGMIDFFVPFSNSVGTAYFELLIFVISLLCLATALASRKLVKKEEVEMEPAPNPTARRSRSLAYTDFRRAISFGKIYLIISIVIAPLYSIIFTFIPSNQASTTVVPVIATELPALMLPIFAILGSLGGLMIFASDKLKGVFEYLIAYGVDTATIFWATVLATVGLVSIVLGISLSAMTAILLISGKGLSFAFVETAIFYAIPISYTGAMFTSMAGMIWSSLTTRRAGVNSPVGIAPILGIFPVLAVLILSSVIGPELFVPFVSGVSLALVAVVAAMIFVSNKKMARERFLSNA
jgi:hypothetical protein